MSPERSPMNEFGKSWARALEANEPELDLEASLARLQASRAAVDPARVSREKSGPQRIPGGGKGAIRPASWMWLAAAAALVLAVFGGVRHFWVPSGSPFLAQSGAALETRVGERSPLRFSEGSEVVVEGQSRMEVRSVDAHGASLALLTGAVSAHIIHRSDTHWSFAAGPFTVRVTGTRLRVAWQPATEHFEVEVTEGSVVVTGPLLGSGQAVVAGQRCVVRLPEASLEFGQMQRGPVPSRGPASAEPAPIRVTDLPIAESADPDPASSGGLGLRLGAKAPTSGTASGAPATSFLTWQMLEHDGRYLESIEAAQREGLATIVDTGSAQDLMTLARASRFTKRFALERRCLLRCRERFSGDPQAAIAAFLLGRSSEGGEAATWFTRYLEEQPKGALAREAAGRLVESLERTGNIAATREAARRYLAAYPTGPHAAFARKALE